jgi:hypothetical protein
LTKQPAKLQRPGVNLEAILALIGVLLGFLFIVVIYFLEYPHEALSTWGMPLIMFLTICYALGLSIIGSIISHEINFFLANKSLEIDPFPAEQYTKLTQSIKQSLRRSIQLLLYFIFSFGLFLINLASFAAAKFFYPVFAQIENAILVFWGPLGLMIIQLVVMFLIQLILIFPFSRFQGNLWDSFKIIEKLQQKNSDSTE